MELKEINMERERYLHNTDEMLEEILSKLDIEIQLPLMVQE
jgi:hypothetical protein